MTALGNEMSHELAPQGSAHGSAKFHVVVEGPPRDLHPILRDEVYAIAREAVRNAFRHAVNAESDMKVVAEASNRQEAIEKFRLHRSDGGAGAHFRRLSVASPTRRLLAGGRLARLSLVDLMNLSKEATGRPESALCL